jgi:hypothetical protein
MLALLEADGLPERTREGAAKVFRLLAEAEATIHGRAPEEVHFHEIAGIDTAVDVIGAFLALESLDARTVSATPLSTGQGLLRCAHGTLPLPAPATLEILKRGEVPFVRTEEPHELLTPTGAALLAVMVDAFGPGPAGGAVSVGYGAGSRDLPGRPNVLRATLARRLDAAPPAGLAADTVWELRATVDDMTPEAIGHALEAALGAGAVEAYAAPVVMKKSRPGLELTCLAPPEALASVEEALLRETSTFGWRRQAVPRAVLPRTLRTVEVAGHPVRVKIARRAGAGAGGCLRAAAEYDDCRRAAAAEGLSLAEVRFRAEAAAREAESGRPGP